MALWTLKSCRLQVPDLAAGQLLPTTTGTRIWTSVSGTLGSGKTDPVTIVLIGRIFGIEIIFLIWQF
jgi:hypothetical protein